LAVFAALGERVGFVDHQDERRAGRAGGAGALRLGDDGRERLADERGDLADQSGPPRGEAEPVGEHRDANGTGERVAEGLRERGLPGAHVTSEDEDGRPVDQRRRRGHGAAVVAAAPVGELVRREPDDRLLNEPLLDGVEADEAGVPAARVLVGVLQDGLEQVVRVHSGAVGHGSSIVMRRKRSG
jgi:hypothetical protein